MMYHMELPTNNHHTAIRASEFLKILHFWLRLKVSVPGTGSKRGRITGLDGRDEDLEANGCLVLIRGLAQMDWKRFWNGR